MTYCKTRISAAEKQIHERLDELSALGMDVYQSEEFWYLVEKLAEIKEDASKNNPKAKQSKKRQYETITLFGDCQWSRNEEDGSIHVSHWYSSDDGWDVKHFYNNLELLCENRTKIYVRIPDEYDRNENDLYRIVVCQNTWRNDGDYHAIVDFALAGWF